jgi:uncharacterized phage-associated protein
LLAVYTNHLQPTPKYCINEQYENQFFSATLVVGAIFMLILSPSMASFTLFSEKKAEQAAAFFLHAAKGELAVLKLVKLLYLAERRSFEKFGEPIIGDRIVSMQHGPVLSRTLDYINGAQESVEGGWETWIADRANHNVALRDPSCIRTVDEDLLELSDSDIEVLRETWQKFGHMTKYQLRDFTHFHCPEWSDPEGSSVAVSYEQLLAALKFPPDKIQSILEHLEERSKLSSLLAAS